MLWQTTLNCQLQKIDRGFRGINNRLHIYIEMPHNLEFLVLEKCFAENIKTQNLYLILFLNEKKSFQ